MFTKLKEMKKRLSHDDVELMLDEADDTSDDVGIGLRQRLVEKRAVKALRKDLGSRPEKKWVEEKRKKF